CTPNKGKDARATLAARAFLAQEFDAESQSDTRMLPILYDLVIKRRITGIQVVGNRCIRAKVFTRLYPLDADRLSRCGGLDLQSLAIHLKKFTKVPPSRVGANSDSQQFGVISDSWTGIGGGSRIRQSRS
ncbi:MAG: hypothetical protein OEO83_17820, partial [Alphaproteobacteria bacterium]|nr:hypothetical protein [Alphaproteobacteria bacterium]